MSLQQELGIKHSIEPLETEVNMNLWFTREQSFILHSRLFRQYNLTSTQFVILYILQDGGAPLTIRKIADRLTKSFPGTTGLIDRLEKEGLVTRERCATDRRVVYVTLTDKGQATFLELGNLLRKLHEKLFGHLTKAELKEFIWLFEKARERLIPLLAEQKDD